MDADVIRYLKIFTLLPDERIAELEESLAKEPEKREAQRTLAEEVTRMVHGEKGLAIAKAATNVLFGGSVNGLTAADLEGIFANVKSATLPAAEVIGKPLIDVTAAAKMFASKGEARRMIQQGGVSVNNIKVPSIERIFEAGDLIEGRVAVLRSGKKNFFLLKVE